MVQCFAATVFRTALTIVPSGAKGVALVDIQDEATFQTGKEAVEKYGAKCITIHANVSKEEEIERAVAEAVKEFGRIDYAANFAGSSRPSLPLGRRPFFRLLSLDYLANSQSTKNPPSSTIPEPT